MNTALSIILGMPLQKLNQQLCTLFAQNTGLKGHTALIAHEVALQCLQILRYLQLCINLLVRFRVDVWLSIVTLLNAVSHDKF